jgi:hypothetical protein
VDFVVCTLAVEKKIRAGFDMSDRTIPLLVKVFADPEEKNVEFIRIRFKTSPIIMKNLFLVWDICLFVTSSAISVVKDRYTPSNMVVVFIPLYGFTALWTLA